MTPVTFVAARFTTIGRSVRDASRRVWPFLYGAAADLVVLAGVGAVAYGIALISRPSAWIFVGLMAILIGVRGAQPPKPRSPE